MSDLYVMKSKCVLNGVGLYSKEQVEELEKRGDDLWKTLNWVNSGLWVYVDALEKEMAKNGSVDKTNIVVANAIEKLKEMTDGSWKALNGDS